MPHPTTSTAATVQSPALAGINRMIEIAQEQQRTLIEQAGDTAERGPGGSYQPRGGPPLPAGTTLKIEDLDVVITRLNSIREWLIQDPRLLPLVDDYISQQVKAMEQRQGKAAIRQGALWTIIGVILGWGASLLGSPAAVFQHFVGR